MATPVRAAIYVRISDDALGQGLGVERQEADCRALCAERGFEVAGVYCDNDVSASTGTRRPAYERLLADVAASRVEAVVVWDLDRLHRRPAELERFIELADERGLGLASVGGDVDLATVQGRMMARIKGAVARAETEQLSRRVLRKHRELAERGSWSGGRRPFGYALAVDPADRRPRPRHVLVVNEAEAAEIRAAIDRVLNGASLRSIAADWDAREVRTPQGKRWRPELIRHLLMSPRLAGFRSHHGALYEAAWPPIIDRDTHETLRALLGGSRRTERTPTGRLPRRYLLLGFVHCGVCGHRLYATSDAGKRGYACEKDQGGCGAITRRAEPLEVFVVELLMAVLSSPKLAGGLRAVDQASEQAQRRVLLDAIRVDEHQLEELVLDRADGVLTRAQFELAKSRVETRLDQARRELARLMPTVAPVELPTGDLAEVRAAWDRLDVDRQRDVLGVVLESVLVHRAVRGRTTFDPTKVEPIWRV